MSGRGLDPTLAAAMRASHVTHFLLVEMAFDSQKLYLCGLAFPVDWNGNTYLQTLGIGSVQAITETDAEVQGLSFTLSGVPPSSLALAQSEPYQGRNVIVRQVVVLDDGSFRVDPNVWQGTLDTMVIDDSAETSSITVTAEHALANWSDPVLVRFSHEDQQAIAPGDLFFQFAAQMSEATLVWPNKEFFKQ